MVGISAGIRPDFRLIANSQDITDTIREHLISLSCTDEAGLESDTLEILLQDQDITLPATGAELELFLGYDGALDRIGLFVVDALELRGWPTTLSISAKAAVFEKSKGGKSTLQSQKRRSWAKGTLLGDLVKKIAQEHGLTAAVAGTLAGITLPHIDQTEESDISLLSRLAKKYDAVVKPTDGRLVLARRGDAASVGGTPLPSITLEPGDVADYSVKIERREASGSVVATWRETRKAKRHVVKVGEGEPVTRLRTAFATQAMARSAAQSEMTKRARAAATLSLNTAGSTDLRAETPLNLTGFREGASGRWIIKKVTHSLGTSGYRCSVDAETPNPPGETKVSTS